MSEQQRIERWVNVYPGGEGLECYTREEADRDQDLGRIRCARLVEIREGESIGVDPATVNMAPWSVVDEARRERDTAIERAEKAEAVTAYAVAKANDETDHWKSRALAAELNANDERARFERETAAKMLAALWGSDWNGDVDCATALIIERAAMLADHYFGVGAKEAKG